MKKLLSVLLCAAFILCLSGCVYNPPEGYTNRHHSYEEVLAYAKAIDPDAVVSEEHTDTIDEYNWEYREWDAVINGVNCHVSSVSDWVWNEGLMAGEFTRTYYRIDTDYDFAVLNNILAEKYPDWKAGQTIRSRYHHNTNTILAELVMSEVRMFSDDELEQIWQIASEINSKYEKYAIKRSAGFCIPSPGTYYSQADGETYLKISSFAYITEFTEQGKEAFFNEYHENWALLDSGLPIRD